jgi:very-short-patch-repair endonuclease
MSFKSNPRLDYPIYCGANPEIIKIAKENRKNMTPAEKKLWHYLQNRKLSGMKFRRQHPVSKFIADFYCHEVKLIIEVDGGYHLETHQKDSDVGREFELKDLDLTIIRFRNEEIENNIDDVLERIKTAIKDQISH